MAQYIVEIQNTSGAPGSRPFVWVIFEAESGTAARQSVQESLSSSEVAGIVLPATAKGIEQFRVNSPAFAERFQTSNTPDEILSAIGVVDPNKGLGATTDPGVREDFLPSVAFERALQSLGFTGGVPRGIAGSAESALNSLFAIGRAAGSQRPEFQNLREFEERENFFENVLPSLIGGGGPSLTQRALDVFNSPLATSGRGTELSAFLDPRFGAYAGTGPGQSGVTGLSGTEAAEALAELGRRASGARFGALFDTTPSARRLVTEFGAQNTGGIGGGETDLRTYIRGRLGI